jgi:hypothetical protein
VSVLAAEAGEYPQYQKKNLKYRLLFQVAIIAEFHDKNHCWQLTPPAQRFIASNEKKGPECHFV